MLATAERTERIGAGPVARRRGRPVECDHAAAVIIEAVSLARGVTRAQIMGRRKARRMVTGRQLAMYLVHTLLGRTYLETAMLFGRDRTTVSHACARIEDMRDRLAFEREVTRLEQAILNTLDREPADAAH